MAPTPRPCFGQRHPRHQLLDSHGREGGHQVNGITVIIPTYNRPSNLGQCLNALSQVNGEGLVVEVIVVNDGGCPLDAQGLDAVLPGVVILEQANTGPAGAPATPVSPPPASHIWPSRTTIACLNQSGCRTCRRPWCATRQP